MRYFGLGSDFLYLFIISNKEYSIRPQTTIGVDIKG